MMYAKHQQKTGQGGTQTLTTVMDIVIGIGILIAIIAWVPGAIANYQHRDIEHPAYYWDQAVKANCPADQTYTIAQSGSVSAFTYDAHNADQRTQCMMMASSTMDISNLFWVTWEQLKFITMFVGVGMALIGVVGTLQKK